MQSERIYVGIIRCTYTLFLEIYRGNFLKLSDLKCVMIDVPGITYITLIFWHVLKKDVRVENEGSDTATCVVFKSLASFIFS